MNVIVNDETQWIPLAVALAVMLAISTTLLVWAKRKAGSSVLRREWLKI